MTWSYSTIAEIATSVVAVATWFVLLVIAERTAIVGVSVPMKSNLEANR